MAANGVVCLADGAWDLDSAAAIVSTHNGVPLTAARRAAVAVEGAIAFTRNGLGLTSAGRVAVSTANAVATIHNGLGFDSAGRVCVATAGTFAQHNGALFDATRKAKATIA